MRHLFSNLPMPPSVNTSYVTVGNRRVKSASLVRFNLEMDNWSLSHFKELQNATKDLKGHKLEMSLIFYFPQIKILTKAGNPKRLDVSNRIKAIEDTFCRLIEIDDCHIFSVHACKKVGTCEKVSLKISPIEE